MIWIKLSRNNNNYFHACCGFTLFEFGVVAIIVGVLGAVLLGRLALYQQQAESAAAERVVGTLHTALTLRTAALIVANREHELPKMSDENPMDWLVEKPKNYLGEFYSSQINELQRGNWYYDRSNKTLVFLPSNGNSFAQWHPKFLKFNVRLTRLSSNPVKPPEQPVNKRIVLDQAF